MNISTLADNYRLTHPAIEAEPNLATFARALINQFNVIMLDGDELATLLSNTVALSAAISVQDPTTPSVSLATGKTNTGFFLVYGKTSGSLKITTADATAQAITINGAAQTSGASIWTIPDAAGANQTFVTLALAQTLTNKTLTAPVIGGAATMAANASLTPAAGTGAFDLSLATGIMKTPTSSTNLFTFGQKTAAGAATNLLAAATGTAIPVTANGSLPITQNGAETNTLAIPTFLGQVLDLFVDTDTSGARVITSAQRINQAGNTIITLSDVGDYIRLVAITIGGALRWQVAANDGAVLS